MKFIKLGLCHFDKTFFISKVSKECFNNSDNIERAGFLEVFKIYSKKDLNFRLKEEYNKKELIYILNTLQNKLIEWSLK